MIFLKNKFLQYFCLFLIGYSVLGGLLVPLSPNFEKLNYTQTDSTLKFDFYMDGLSEGEGKFYLQYNSLKPEDKKVYSSSLVTRKDIHYQVEFSHPKFYKGFESGHSFDIVCYTRHWGNLRYFGAYYLDTVIGNLTLNQDFSFYKNTLLNEFHLTFPNRNILNETIRNLFFHVPMWFTMIALLIYSLIHSILFLKSGHMDHDLKAFNSSRVALIFGTLGILTGMIWAKYTWGAFWTNDPKLNGAAIGMLAYSAYFILRNSLEDEIKRAKLSAVYNIFSFTIYCVFIIIIPRVNDSLHPGNGGNPGFNIYEQDNVMRLFFYPAVLGWIMMGFWLTELYYSISKRK